jgi:four helix bundle protein
LRGIRLADHERMPHENLKERTFQFALGSIRVVKPLADDPLGRHLIGQAVRSSGGVAANYSSACHAKSRRDFAAKIMVVAEEAAETAIWLRLFRELGLLGAEDARPLLQEAMELTAIAVASAATARRRRKE